MIIFMQRNLENVSAEVSLGSEYDVPFFNTVVLLIVISPPIL